MQEVLTIRRTLTRTNRTRTHPRSTAQLLFQRLRLCHTLAQGCEDRRLICLPPKFSLENMYDFLPVFRCLHAHCHGD